MKLTSWKCFIIVLRIAVGAILLYSGLLKINETLTHGGSLVQMAKPTEDIRYLTIVNETIRAKYFWPILGSVEVLCGLLIASQYLSLLGAILLMPITLNYVIYQVVSAHNLTGLFLTLLFFISNILLITYYHKSFRSALLQLRFI
jgi:uncharacterized membrane protein YphA (DoxX/SURF4 family)